MCFVEFLSSHGSPLLDSHAMEEMRRLHSKDQNLLQSLHNAGTSPETYRFLLERCTADNSLENGRTVHAHIIKKQCESDAAIATSLVNMYIKCRSLDDACASFIALNLKKVVLWNAIIAALTQDGRLEEAIHFFWEIERRELSPNEVTYLNTFKACALLRSIGQGFEVHRHIIVSGLELTDFTANTMIDMYAKCGSLEDAYVVFRTMNMHTLASWNVMISGFSQHRYFGEVLRFFRQMLSEGFQPDDYTLVVILRACIDTEALQFGQSLHDFLIRSSTLTGVYVTNALMAMYAKCKCIEDANTVFRLASERDLVTWNTMIGGLLENGQNTKSLELFQCMRTQGMKPDRATFIGVLKACIALGSLDMGKMVHACFIEDEDSQCILLMSTLVDMYTKCGSTEDARRIFNKMHTRNAVLWNIMLAGYSHSVEEAVKLFEQMEGDSLKPDEVTFLNLLKGCQTEEHLEFCQLIHNCCIEYGHETDLYIGSCLVDVYSTCGSLIEAWRVFEVMPERNVVSWNAIVTGCAERGDGEDVLELYEQMQVEGLHAEDITYVSVFNACAETTNFKQGRIIHSLILFSGREQNLFVDNALVDMYGKCGVLCEAFRVFRNMPVKDIVSWNALISCYSQHGYGTQTLGLAQEMIREGISFNEVTLVGILTACSYAGFIEEAQTYFNTMYRSHGVIPTSEHYACMVDVYGRAGLLDEAAQFIKQLPIEPTSVIWMALLAASRTCGSTILALYAAAQVSLTDPQNSAAFLMLSSLRSCKQWDAAITCE